MIPGGRWKRAVHEMDYPIALFSSFKRFFPIYFFLTYLTTTILLFAFGPWRYPLEGQALLTLYIFLLFANLCLFWGYSTGIQQVARVPKTPTDVSRILQLSAIVTLILFLPTCLHRTGTWFPEISSAITDPGSAYANSLLSRETGNGYVEYARILAGPLLTMVLPITVFYWADLRWLTRLLGVGAVTSTLLLFIAMGTNKAIADTVLLAPCMLLAAHWAGKLKIHLSRGPLILISALSFFSFFLFFSSTMASRAGSTASYGYMPSISDRADSTDLVGKLVPSSYMPGYLGMTSYVTQGYYALGLCLQEPYVPTWGVGNSMFLTKQAERFVSTHSIASDTYPFRIEKHGWDSIRLWSSIYPWLASDVSFPGVLVLMFFIGRIFALAWSDTLVGVDPFGVVMFSLLCTMIFYFPANNQLLQSGEGFTAFWITLVIWLGRRGQSLQLIPAA